MARINRRVWSWWFGFDWASLWKAIFDTEARIFRAHLSRLPVHPAQEVFNHAHLRIQNPKGHQNRMLMGSSFGSVQGCPRDLIVAINCCVLSCIRKSSSEQNGKKETKEQNMITNIETASNTMLSRWIILIVLGSLFLFSMMASSLEQSIQWSLCAPWFVCLAIRVYW